MGISGVEGSRQSKHRANSPCKGPVAGLCLACWRTIVGAT